MNALQSRKAEKYGFKDPLDNRDKREEVKVTFRLNIWMENRKRERIDKMFVKYPSRAVHK